MSAESHDLIRSKKNTHQTEGTLHGIIPMFGRSVLEDSGAEFGVHPLIASRQRRLGVARPRAQHRPGRKATRSRAIRDQLYYRLPRMIKLPGSGFRGTGCQVSAGFVSTARSVVQGFAMVSTDAGSVGGLSWLTVSLVAHAI